MESVTQPGEASKSTCSTTGLGETVLTPSSSGTKGTTGVEMVPLAEGLIPLGLTLRLSAYRRAGDPVRSAGTGGGVGVIFSKDVRVGAYI